MNVFAGKNGSGKTTVLEAANVVLGHILQRLRHMYLPGLCLISNQLMQDERLRFQMIAEFTAGAIPQYPCKVSCKAAWNIDYESIGFQRVLLKQDGRTKFGGKIQCSRL